MIKRTSAFKRIIKLFLIAFIFQPQPAFSAKKIHIYIDADFSIHSEPAESIEKGIKVALSKIDFKIHGREIKIIRKDNRTNPVRSKKNIMEYLKDPHALLVYSGMHSPPLLMNRDFINKNEVLTLIPWAAAGPITRFPSKNNWMFRLSIDDTKAGFLISEFAIKEKGYKKPFLILEHTGWGKSNYKTMSKALTQLGVKDFRHEMFDWNLKKAGAKSLISKVIQTKSDVIFLVANDFEGAAIVNAVLDFPLNKRVPILSHWGILGGNFHKKIPTSKRNQLDLMFIQTNFSFNGRKLNTFEKSVFDKIRKMFPSIQHYKDLPAPPGFIHAYDLTTLLIEALKRHPLTGNIKKDRRQLRKALEQIRGPIRGLVKTYRFPFGRYSKLKNDAHEALRIEDFAMAKFGNYNEILLDPWQFRTQKRTKKRSL